MIYYTQTVYVYTNVRGLEGFCKGFWGINTYGEKI